MQMNQNPLNKDDFLKLLKALELISANLDRLFTQGALLDESLTDGQISSSQKRIEIYRQRIAKEQQRIRKLRDYLKHKRELNKQHK